MGNDWVWWARYYAIHSFSNNNYDYDYYKCWLVVLGVTIWGVCRQGGSRLRGNRGWDEVS